MAYRNFSETNLIAVTADADRTGFSALEWSVVALARRDSIASLEKPGRIAVALGALFGDRRNPRLADPRLEALRRFVVLARHLRDRLPDREIGRFLSAGFTRAQARLLRPAA
jgi:hypothetical protein